jgi:hypothetical protein
LPLNPPPRDASGQVTPHDDASILGSSALIRHINPSVHVVPDDNTGGRRLSSAAFSATNLDPQYGMSTDIGQMLSERGLAEDAMVPTGMGAVRLRVDAVRALDLSVGSDPEPGNWAHGQVWGVKDSKRRKLHKVVEDWVVPLVGVALR